MITPAKLLRTALLTVAISTVCVVSASAASVGVGTVNTDALRLRDEATTDSTILATAAKGDTVVVLEDTGDGWYKVDYNSVEGYMSGEYLDCSGYTSSVYRHFGYTLNRTASGQLSNGTSVSKSELQPGDLVFFRYNTSKAASHVGIYIGGGQFIHASTNTYTVKIDTLTSGHYANVYVGARRIF